MPSGDDYCLHADVDPKRVCGKLWYRVAFKNILVDWLLKDIILPGLMNIVSASFVGKPIKQPVQRGGIWVYFNRSLQFSLCDFSRKFI